MLLDRRARIALRVLAAVLVAAWLLAGEVRARLPFWLPFAILLAAEVEFVVRGLLEMRRGGPPKGDLPDRRAPGSDDADLGWGDLVEEVDEHGEPVVRWVPPPQRPPRRSHGLVYAAGAVLAVALLVVAYRVDRGSSWSSLSTVEQAQTESRLRREAGLVAGKPVRLECDDAYRYTGIGSDALGVAFPARALAYLQPSVCRELHDGLGGDLDPTDAAGEAVLVLAHEAVHLRGETREGVTECLGLQEGIAVAERLGWDRQTAEHLMRRRYEAILAERSITRVNYQLPSECRDGGSLDQREDDPGFP